MQLMTDFADPAEDRGTPVLFQKSSEPDGEDAYIHVRRIPTKEAAAIEFRHSGRKTPALMKKAGALINIDNDVSRRETAEKAVYALVDTKAFDVVAGDGGSAAFYTRVLGREVKVGDAVRLDGNWTEEVKKRIFAAAPLFARRVLVASIELDLANRQEEEGKDES